MDRHHQLVEKSNEYIHLVTKRKTNLLKKIHGYYKLTTTCQTDKDNIRVFYNTINVIYDAYVSILQDTDFGVVNQNRERLSEVDKMVKEYRIEEMLVKWDANYATPHTLSPWVKIPATPLGQRTRVLLRMMSSKVDKYIKDKDRLMPRSNRVEENGPILGNLQHIKRNKGRLTKGLVASTKHKLGLRNNQSLLSGKSLGRIGKIGLGAAGILLGAMSHSAGFAAGGAALIAKQRQKIHKDRERNKDNVKAMAEYRRQLKDAASGMKGRNPHITSRLAGGGAFKAKKHSSILVGDNPGGVESVSIHKKNHAYKAQTHGPELIRLGKGDSIKVHPVSGVGQSIVDPKSLAPTQGMFAGGTDGGSWEHVGGYKRRKKGTSPVPEMSPDQYDDQFEMRGHHIVRKGMPVTPEHEAAMRPPRPEPIVEEIVESVKPLVEIEKEEKKQTVILQKLVDDQELFHKEQIAKMDDAANASKGYSKATPTSTPVIPATPITDNKAGKEGLVGHVKDVLAAGVVSSIAGALGTKLLGSVASGTIGATLKSVSKNAPLIGGVIAGVGNYNSGAGAGASIGSGIGTLAGGAAGTLLDPFIGPFGTILGATAGEYIGKRLGGLFDGQNAVVDKQNAVIDKQLNKKTEPRNAKEALDISNGNGASGFGATGAPGIVTSAVDWAKSKLGMGTPSTSIKTDSTQAKVRESMLQQAALKAGIKDPKELASFMGQMSHETGGFAAMREQGSGAQYEGRRSLGNTQTGDGERYKGRGYIQLTGRSNYAAYGKKIGVDLVNHPELAEQPDVAAKIAIAYWQDHGSGEMARAGNFEGVSKSINGVNPKTGRANGADDRTSRTQQYLASFSNGTTPSRVTTPIGNTAAVPKGSFWSDPLGTKALSNQRASDMNAIYRGGGLPAAIDAQAQAQFAADATLDENGIPKSMKGEARPKSTAPVPTSPLKFAPVPSTVVAVSPSAIQNAHIEQHLATQQDRAKVQEKERLDRSVQNSILQNMNGGAKSTINNTTNGGGTSGGTTLTTGDNSLLAMYNMFMGQVVL